MKYTLRRFKIDKNDLRRMSLINIMKNKWENEIDYKPGWHIQSEFQRNLLLLKYPYDI